MVKTLFATVVALADANFLQRGLSDANAASGCPSWITPEVFNNTLAALDGTKEQLSAMFGPKCDDGAALYNYAGFCDALGNQAIASKQLFNGPKANANKLELANFLADIAKGTSFCFVKDTSGVTACNTTNVQTGKAYTCTKGQQYYGRGAMMLTWNFNYGAFGDFVGKDYLDDPSLLETDGMASWMSAMWYWSTPQGDLTLTQRICHDAAQNGDFAATTEIINGPNECVKSNIYNDNRIKLYKAAAKSLGVTVSQTESDIDCTVKA